MIDTLNRLAEEIHKTAIEHGWWETERELPEILMLCVSELSEALEEYRNGRPNEWYILGESTACPAKPEGIAVEMVDCIIRILDYLSKIGVDIDGIMERKMKYNESRPYRHGGKKC